MVLLQAPVIFSEVELTRSKASSVDGEGGTPEGVRVLVQEFWATQRKSEIL